MPALGTAPEHKQPRDHKQICGAVEDAVPKRVELEVLDRVLGIPAAQHVVPLQELVQHDAVEKAAESQPEEHARRLGKMPLLGVHQ